MSVPVFGNQYFSNTQNIAGTGIQNILADSITSASSLSGATSVGVETLTTANNGAYISLDTTVTLLNGTSGSFTVTLGNGKYVGQMKFISNIGNSNNTIVTISNMYVLGSPSYSITLNNEIPLQFVWDGIKWAPLTDVRNYD